MKDRALRLNMREHAIKTAERFSEPAAVDDWLSVLGVSDPEGAIGRSWTGLLQGCGEDEGVEESERRVANLRER